MNRHILLLDSGGLWRNAVERRLSEHGFVVQQADFVGEITYEQVEDYDLVVVGATLYENAEKFARSLFVLRKPYIVFVTSERIGISEIRELFVRMKAVDVIPGTADVESILEAVRHYFNDEDAKPWRIIES